MYEAAQSPVRRCALLFFGLCGVLACGDGEMSLAGQPSADTPDAPGVPDAVAAGAMGSGSGPPASAGATGTNPVQGAVDAPPVGAVTVSAADIDAVAPAGKMRLFVGQDLDSIAAYTDTVGAPGGAVGYTSLAALEGLDSLADNGGGPNHLDALAARHPGLPLALGLYLVGDLPAINAGERDGSIARLAAVLQAHGVPVLLRVGYEFDLDWTAYEPGAYREAFRRIAEGVRSAGATHVQLVWQSAAPCGARYLQQPLEAWYPGDEFVDWVAVSSFAMDSCYLAEVGRVADFSEARGKPLFVAEAAPKNFDIGELTFSLDGAGREDLEAEQIWSRWFVPFLQLLESRREVIRAVSYINADWDTQWQFGPPYTTAGYWGDSRLQANTRILELWQQQLQQDRWLR